MGRILSVIGIGAVLLAAVALATALGRTGAAEAQTTEGPETTPANVTTPEAPATINEILSELVEENVITQEQADRVEEALRERSRGHVGPFGHRFARPGGFAAKPDIAAILGLDPEELRDALAEGNSLGEIADETEGVSRESLIEALIAAGNERIDAALEAGHISDEDAAAWRRRVGQHAEAMVDGDLPEGGFPDRRLPGARGRGFGHFGPPPGTDD